MQSVREVSFQRSLLLSSSTLMMAESVLEHGYLFYQTTWRDIPKTVILIRLSDHTRGWKITFTMYVICKGLYRQESCGFRCLRSIQEVPVCTYLEDLTIFRPIQECPLDPLPHPV